MPQHLYKSQSAESPKYLPLPNWVLGSLLLSSYNILIILARDICFRPLGGAEDGKNDNDRTRPEHHMAVHMDDLRKCGLGSKVSSLYPKPSTLNP